MRILILAQCYAPENVSAAVLITNLATDLAIHGHQVTVVTGAPSYPHGRVLHGYRNLPYSSEILEGVRVIRTWSYISPSKKTLPRLFHYGTYSASAFYGGLFAGRPDVIVSFSPPLPLGISAWLLSKIFHVPWLLQIEDLFPDAAIAAGVMVNQQIIKFFLAVESFLYKHSQRISVISHGFRETLIKKNVPSSKIELIPVWADPNEVRPLQKDNNFRKQHRLCEKFIVMYAGNIGLTSCLEDVLHAGELLHEQEDIQFVIVGEGVKKDALEAEMAVKQIKNILFLPYQPREIFPEILAAADVSLVTLNSGAALSSMPSKIFNVMASARPILAITPPGSEIMQIIETADCGRNVPPGSPEQLAETILLLKKDESDLLRMGQNGRICLENYYSRNQCVDAYEKMLANLVGNHS